MSIARIMLNDLKSVMTDKGIEFTFSNSALEFIAQESFSLKYGARNMRRYIQKEIEDKLANAMIFEIKGPLTGATVDISEDNIKVDCI